MKTNCQQQPMPNKYSKDKRSKIILKMFKDNHCPFYGNQLKEYFAIIILWTNIGPLHVPGQSLYKL